MKKIVSVFVIGFMFLFFIALDASHAQSTIKLSKIKIDVIENVLGGTELRVLAKAVEKYLFRTTNKDFIRHTFEQVDVEDDKSQFSIRIDKYRDKGTGGYANLVLKRGRYGNEVFVIVRLSSNDYTQPGSDARLREDIKKYLKRELELTDQQAKAYLSYVLYMCKAIDRNV